MITKCLTLLSAMVFAISAECAPNYAGPSSGPVPVTIGTECAPTWYKGPSYSGTIPVTIVASDDVGVTRVELLVDGTLVAILDAPPYVVNWNSKMVPNGIVKLTARAYDAAGNVGVSKIVWLKIINHK